MQGYAADDVNYRKASVLKGSYLSVKIGTGLKSHTANKLLKEFSTYQPLAQETENVKDLDTAQEKSQGIKRACVSQNLASCCATV